MDRPALCVLCHARPVDPNWRPFCSRRCQVIDQGRWADESYRVPVSPPQPDEEPDDHTDG
ncbi:MAG TPA: DNA gyrase inhibitor YacG [Vicinamibacterales bacterium]|nr:DNA gyrase inhibitor YacG [Vicinamibacterales bacterium]